MDTQVDIAFVRGNEATTSGPARLRQRASLRRILGAVDASVRSYALPWAFALQAKRHRVGLDVEAFRFFSASERDLFLWKSERRALETLTIPSSETWFWTLKEALFKIGDLPPKAGTFASYEIEFVEVITLPDFGIRGSFCVPRHTGSTFRFVSMHWDSHWLSLVATDAGDRA